MSDLNPAPKAQLPLPKTGDTRYVYAMTQNNAPVPDHELMEAIGQGDRAAFTVLADRHTGKALAYVMRLLNGDRSTAEDIVQEGFIRVWQHAATWEPQAQFNTWFYTALYRLCVDYWRKNKRPVVELDEEMADKSPDAESICITAQQHAQLHQALQQLPETQRSALMLFHSRGLTQNEVAKVMNLSVGAVESLLFRGRQKLKTLLTQETNKTGRKVQPSDSAARDRANEKEIL
jgi:RNA polymerase sigma-70 factor (ECF subfamily)